MSGSSRIGRREDHTTRAGGHNNAPGTAGTQIGGGCEAALARAQAEIERLRATVTEQAVALHLHEGKARWD